MMTGEPSLPKQAGYSANMDWVRALQRTSTITMESKRTLAVAVHEHASERPDHPAILGTDGTLTYADLSARVNRYARWGLAQGLVKGDRVALMLANHPDYAAIWMGLAQIGVVSALVNTQLAGEGLAHVLRTAEAKHLIVGGAFVDALADLNFRGSVWVHGVAHPQHPRVDDAVMNLADTSLGPDEVGTSVTLRDQALLIYTSGTTGLPKAAHVSQYRVMMWSEWFAGILGAVPEDRLYDCLPMYHSVGGVVAVGAMLSAGGSVIVRDGFSARRFWPDLVSSGATIFQYIGELCRYLLTAPHDRAASSHRLRLAVGNGLRADVWEDFAARFSIPRIIEFYAATEGSFSLFNLEGRPGAIGRVPRFIAHRSPVAIVEFDVEAERPVRGADGYCRRCLPGTVGEAIGKISREPSGLATRFEGYTSEAETRRKILRDVFEPGDMWFRTGDLMRQDASGFFYFVDRIGDTFRWKGENVATSEVADAVAAHDGVLDAAVYGVAVPNADGRAGMAALVVRPGFDPASLREYLEARLPRAARPVFLRIRDEMALTGTFKLKKQDLVRDGFDPQIVTDELYVDDPSATGYVLLDRERFARIATGDLRL